MLIHAGDCPFSWISTIEHYIKEEDEKGNDLHNRRNTTFILVT